VQNQIKQNRDEVEPDEAEPDEAGLDETELAAVASFTVIETGDDDDDVYKSVFLDVNVAVKV
jgi:hypothetical protein